MATRKVRLCNGGMNEMAKGKKQPKTSRSFGRRSQQRTQKKIAPLDKTLQEPSAPISMQLQENEAPMIISVPKEKLKRRQAVDNITAIILLIAAFLQILI